MAEVMSYTPKNLEQLNNCFNRMRENFEVQGPFDIFTRKPKSKRSIDQNDKMWAMLGDVSDQHLHHGMRLTKDDWKDLFTASLKGELNNVVPGLNGGVVFLGLHTSTMSIQTMCDLITYIESWAVDKEIKWTEKEK